MRKDQIYIKQHEKTEIVTLSRGGVVTELGFVTPLRGGVEISLQCGRRFFNFALYYSSRTTLFFHFGPLPLA